MTNRIALVTKRDRTMSSTADEMLSIVRAAAEPWSPGDSVKAGINRAARALNLTARRVTTLWYGRPCAVLADEADRLRAWKRRYDADELRRLELKIETLRARQHAIGDALHALDDAKACRCAGKHELGPRGHVGVVPGSRATTGFGH